MKPRPAFANDLAAARDHAFALLAQGATNRRSVFHTPTLATIGADGAPSLRTLVLRGFDPATRTLRLHTDARAAKAAEILTNPRVALHAYDPAAQLQLRLTGHATLHRDDALADAGWAASRDFSRMCYAIADGPGTPAPAPPSAPQDAVSGRAHFSVIALRFDMLEWLWLDAAGHQRARFTFAPDRAAWLVP